MEPPKKPAATRDIADLKARLGIARPTPAPPMGAPVTGQVAPFPSPVAPASAPFPSPAAAVPHPLAAPAQAPAAPAFDPFAGMKPPAGKTFDLRPVDDGAPVESVQARGGWGRLVVMLIFVLVAGAVGFGFGAAAIGRRAYNAANAAARKLKTDLDDVQKSVTQIGVAVAMSQQRLQNAKKDPAAYDAGVIEDLEKVKLDPRPDTSRIFKVDYYRLEDLAVDRLMNYYYDTIALYGEVERHIKRTKADQEQLEAFAARQGEKGQANYGVVFDARGKILLSALVEMGSPVCKSGGSECPADQIDGFQIRSNTGAPWTPRRVGPKPEGDKVVPLDRTPLLEAAMSGSPEQVRMEQYKNRYNSLRLILARLAAEKKELFEAIDKAAARPDLFSL